MWSGGEEGVARSGERVWRGGDAFWLRGSAVWRLVFCDGEGEGGCWGYAVEEVEVEVEVGGVEFEGWRWEGGGQEFGGPWDRGVEF